MSSRPKRENKAPERFQGWISGEKQEPFTVRNTKKKIKSPISHEGGKASKKFHNLNARKGLTKNLDVVLLPVEFEA